VVAHAGLALLDEPGVLDGAGGVEEDADAVVARQRDVAGAEAQAVVRLQELFVVVVREVQLLRDRLARFRLDLREAEAAVLVEFLGSVPVGPVALILEGEAGIGKTSVWNQGLVAAGRRATRTRSSRASPARRRS